LAEPAVPNVAFTAETEPPETAVVFSTVKRTILEPAGSTKRRWATGDVSITPKGTVAVWVRTGRPVFRPEARVPKRTVPERTGPEKVEVPIT
jgi:hypothetical protein